jgi:alkaline phosphatase D
MFLEFFGLDPSQLPSLQGAGNEEGVGGGDSDGGGVYRSFTWGPPGKRVQLVLLDTRFSRSPFIETGIEDAPYKPYPNSMPAGSYQMLSASQWNWLRDQLSPTSGQDQVDLTILVSSIQVLNAQAVWEGWRHLPAERDRLLELLRECGRPSIVLSGDRHVGGMYRYDLESDPVGDGNGDGASGVDGTIVNFSRTVLEVTASSWTHTIPLGAFGSNCSSSQSCDEPDSSRVGDLVRENHFGGIEIDWESRTFTVALRRTGLSPDQEAYERNVPSDAGGIVASFRNLSLHDLLNPG